ncbi:hypothetical protein L1987_36734 [Smallanthus sonchifolius]|uniref:Uncharacterized protein n=1 Tax=Smallanthus sonchifolius TaxID=185202 RepID=A0ACB9HED3_9ASTR|nr:hypothetical protein L1987_36734 [Smallanthus sonchifolius]
MNDMRFCLKDMADDHMAGSSLCFQEIKQILKNIFDKDVGAWSSLISAKSIWWSVGVWVEVPVIATSGSIKQLFLAVADLKVNAKRKKAILAIIMTALWRIWIDRNQRIYKGKGTATSKVIEDIKEDTFLCMKQRARWKSLSIDRWLKFDFNLF